MVGGEREGASSLSELWARFCLFRGLLPCECGRRANMVGRSDAGRGCSVEGEAWCSKSRGVDKVCVCVCLSGRRGQAGGEATRRAEMHSKG